MDFAGTALTSSLRAADPRIVVILDRELTRQRRNLEIIAATLVGGLGADVTGLSARVNRLVEAHPLYPREQTTVEA